MTMPPAAPHEVQIHCHIESVTDLPLRIAQDSDTAEEACFVRLSVHTPNPEKYLRSTDPVATSTESADQQTHTTQIFNSVPLTKRNIQHVSLKANLTLTLPPLHSQLFLNDLLHHDYNIIQVQLIRGTDTSLENLTNDMILAQDNLDLAPLLHQSQFKSTITMTNNSLTNTDTKQKGAPKTAQKKRAPDTTQQDAAPLPEQSTLTYSIKLLNDAPSLLPSEYRQNGNFGNFAPGPIHNLPRRFIEPFLADQNSHEQKLALLKSHIFSYNMHFYLPFIDENSGAVIEREYILRNGRLFQQDASHWDSLIIGFTKNMPFFLSPDTVHHWENMLFNKENIRVTFSRSFNKEVATDPTWEDFNEQKYRAEVQFSTGLAEFLEPGKTQHQFNRLPLFPPAPAEEAVQDDAGKKKIKDKGGVKIPKGLPQELAPEEPLKEDELHPYLAAETSVDLLISFERPLIPLAQDRLKSNAKLSELIPKRDIIHKRLSSTEMFKKQVSNIVRQLVTQYEESARVNRRDSQSSNRERFVFDLNNNGMFFSIKDSLKKAVIAVVQEQFASEQNQDPQQMQQFFNTVYVYLVEHVHEVLNGLYGSEQSTNINAPSATDNTQQLSTLQRLAQESEFELEFNIASKYHQQRIDLAPNSAALWYEFALFNMRIHDEGKAEYCYRQCLGLNLTHTEALLDYAILLMHQQKYKESQVLLNSLLDVDESNVNGWVALSLLYEQMDLDEQAREALNHAKRLLSAGGASISPLDLYLDLVYYILFTLHIDTVAEQLLLKVSAADAQNTSAKHSPNQIHLLYGKMFLILQDYERAEEQLKQALEKQYKYAEAWKLLGDVHFEQNRTAEAKQAYETSISVSQEGNVQDHVLCIRLGRLYLALGEYESAKTIFVRATELWKSALTWMGLGASYYGCYQLDHAEQAMNEANVQNNRNVDVWAWLCIINALRGQIKQAAQCRIQMERCGLNGVKDATVQKIISQVSTSRSVEDFVAELEQVLHRDRRGQ